MEDSAQDQGELLLVTTRDGEKSAEIGGSPSDGAVVKEKGGGRGGADVKLSGKERRKMRRLKNEPRSVVGLGEGPSGVNVVDFVESHATEIKSMQTALKNKRKGKRTFQSLPRHMRRRAMSHNPKRLPRRLREAAAKEMENDGAQAKKKKPQTRQQRRKPSSLRQEENRTHMEHRWLETHIWHVKRVNMVSKYGYRLADHCSDKGVRAAHRSLVNGCLLSDISYYCCNEVTGQQSAIISSLSPLFHMDTGLTIQAKAYLRGHKEGKAVMYEFGSYPNGAIGPVQFLWQAPPPNESTSGQSEIGEQKNKVVKLWIWCHPAAQESVLSELQSTITAHNMASRVHCLPSAGPQPSSFSEVTVAVRDLVRFRLTGPRSHALLMETLKPVWRDRSLPPNVFKGDADLDEGVLSESECDGNVDAPSPPAVKKWWLGEYESRLTAHAEVLAKDYPAIKAADEPAQFPRGAVLGLCVQDPRLFTPSKKTDMVSAFYPQKKGEWSGLFDREEMEVLGNDSDREEDSCDERPDSAVPDMHPSDQSTALPDSLPPELAFSPIWDAAICNSVSKSVSSDHFLNWKRSRKFIRPSELSLGDFAPQIPVLLIQQSPPPSSAFLPPSHTPLGAGWDLVLPSKWAMPFLVSLQYRGARVCGIKELHKCSLESLSLHFPQDFPDTQAGSRHNSAQREELEARYVRRPPDKRHNFGKLLVPTPFHCPWESLVREWSRSRRSSSDEDPRGVKRLAECIPQDVLSKRIKLDGCFERSRESEERSGATFIPNAYVSTAESNCPAFYVVRSREDLNSLRYFIESTIGSKNGKNSLFPQVVPSCKDTLQISFEKFAIDSLLERHASGLVAVQVVAHTSGVINCLDTISLPAVSDLRDLLTSSSVSPYSGPVEVMNKRGMIVLEKDGRLVVGISSLRKKEKVKMKKVNGGTVKLVHNCRLLPIKLTRRTIGHVTTAGYRLTTSLSSGLGFVTVPGLVEVVKCCHSADAPTLLALARGPSTKYYFVTLKIV